MTSPRPNLVKQVRHTPDATIVELRGDVDLHHSPALHAALINVLTDHPKRLILNLAEVPYMDSSGVGTLVEVFRRVSGYKGAMVLCGLNPRVRSVMEITKLDHFFTICDTEDQAAQA